MERRATISPITIMKHFGRIARHPWIGSKMAALQGEKWLFNFLYPNSAEGNAGKIRQLSFRITDVCNLRCITCGQWGKEGFLHGKSLKELKKQEVSLPRYKEILADLVEHGHRPMGYIWGGEPMLYEGTRELIEYGAALGLPFSIATNGTRIASAAQRLVDAPLFLLQISIDGHNSELHNRIRPSAGGTDSYAEIQAGLEAVREARAKTKSDLPLIASLTTISKENFRNLVDIYEAYRDRVDLFVFYLSWWIDAKSAQAHDRDFSRRFGFDPKLHWGWLAGWKPADYSILDRQLRTIQARSRAWNLPPAMIIPNVTGETNLRDYYTNHDSRFGFDQCISIFQAVEVDSNGDMSPCRDYHDYVVGNIKTHTITELWNSPVYQKFRTSIATDGLMPVCSRCCGLMGY